MTPIRASTQFFLQIEDIKDDLVVLKDGSVACVLETTAVNFGLLSKDEQEAVVYAFAAFLNSLSFPIQINIVSKKVDISEYLELIKKQEATQKSVKLREKISSYYRFIISLIKENRVLEKRFFIVVPFSYLELGLVKTGSFLSRPKKLPFSKEYILQRAKTALFPKRDHLIRQLSRLGLKAFHLNTQRLVELFYEIYNAEDSPYQRIPEKPTAPIVVRQ